MMEPIAIVGMACRFAGNVRSPEDLWKLCAEGRSGWSEIPPDRFQGRGFHHPNYRRANSHNACGAHFLAEDPSLFDANFFNLTSELAATIDPQIRLQLETVFEAFESAGISLQAVAGTDTSVFAGIFFHDYSDGQLRDPDNLPRYSALGSGSALAANRISHFFDLRGPSMTIDTACSTTLIALHQACQSLRTGESGMSVVGGSNLILDPGTFIALSSISLLSPDGKSYAFDKRANGYGRGEGSATLVLKRLEDALRDGDPIRGVIRGTAANCDGRTVTITTPSGQAQEHLVRECYRKAGLSLAQTTYFEAHGTGTPTGDPIEAKSIASTFRKSKMDNIPLYVGSVKTNIGHTETCSGLASVIKVALALENRQIPPSINFESANPEIDLLSWGLKIPTKLEAWPDVDGIRRASINNFGYGGSNAHIILESYDSFLHSQRLCLPLHALANEYERGSNNHIHSTNSAAANNNIVLSKVVHQRDATATSRYNDSCEDKQSVDAIEAPISMALEIRYKQKQHPRVFILSARDKDSTQAMANALGDFLNRFTTSSYQEEQQLLSDLAYTLGQRRSKFHCVAAISASTLKELIAALSSEKLPVSRVKTEQPRLGYVFTGQGAQWWAMGRELIEQYPAFRDSLLESQNILKSFGCKWILMDELLRDAQTSRLGHQDVAMPICVALQIALVELLSTWGIRPSAITSHSSGEIAAAFAAGALDKENALGIGYARGKCIPQSEGGMLAVGLNPQACWKYINRVSAGKLAVACMNSPSSTTISGDAEAIIEIQRLLDADNVFARRLRVCTAYHSHHILPFASTYETWIRNNLDLNRNHDKEFSAVYASPTTGKIVTSIQELLEPGHWARSLTDPVQFQQALIAMCQPHGGSSSGVDFLIEVGPHSALGGPIMEIASLSDFPQHNIPYFSCLVRPNNAIDTMHRLVCDLIRCGSPVHMSGVNLLIDGIRNVQVIPHLPKYPWDHRFSYWHESRWSKAYKQRQHEPHDLLGSLSHVCNPKTPIWRNQIREEELPWIQDHRIQSNMVYPGAGLICMAIEAALQSSQTSHESMKGIYIRDIEITQALFIPDDPMGIEVTIELRSSKTKELYAHGWKEFVIHSVTQDNVWTELCHGLITIAAEDQQPPWTIDALIQPEAMEAYRVRLFPEDVYSNLRSLGIFHGPVFQNLKSIRARDGQSVAMFDVPDTARSMPHKFQQKHLIHPATLDTIIQSAYPALPESKAGGLRQALVPTSIKSMWIDSCLCSDPGQSFHSYAAVSHRATSYAEFTIRVIDQSSHTPVVSMQGLTLQSLGGTFATLGDLSTKDEKLSRAEWVPDPTYSSYQHVLQQLSSKPSENEVEAIIALRRVGLFFIRQALNSFSDTEILELEGHFQQYHHWMAVQIELARKNILAPESSTWIEDDRSIMRHVISKVKAYNVVGEMVCRLGPSIAAIIRRQKSPEQLLQADSLLERYRVDGLNVERSNKNLCAVVEHMVRKIPRATILDIGSGPRHITQRILNTIGTDDSVWGPLATNYDIAVTDNLPGHLQDLQTRFQSWKSFARLKKLDFRQNALEQDFDASGYDLIICSQPFHPSTSIIDALQNIRQLLKPEGVLLLREPTREQLHSTLVFGLSASWWHEQSEENCETQWRSISNWDGMLRNAGYSGVAFNVPDCNDIELCEFTTMISTSLGTESRNSEEKTAPDVVIVTASDEGRRPPATWTAKLADEVYRITRKVPAVEDLEVVDPEHKLCLYIGDLAGQPVLEAPTHAELRAVKRMCAASEALLWVTIGGTEDCEQVTSSLVSGLLRSVRMEYRGKRLVTLDLKPSNHIWNPDATYHVSQVLLRALTLSATEDQLDYEFSERNGIISVLRYFKDPQKNEYITAASEEIRQPTFEPFRQSGRVLRLIVGNPGLLDTMSFKDDDTFLPEDAIESESLEIEPHAFGINFRDVMVALGQLGEQTTMGFECAGVVTKVGEIAAAKGGFKPGDRVASALVGGYASIIRTPYTNAARIPDSLDFETAASLPVVFCTAFIGLIDKAALQQGERVLIHAAAGGVGQAAILVAKSLGAEVFATVGTAEKRNFLIEKYGIPDDHIFSSRDISFSAGVRLRTQNEGVDVVLNSLSGSLLHESLGCLRRFGRFVEIGKRDLQINSRIDLAAFNRCITFLHIDLAQLSLFKGDLVRRAMQRIMEFVEQGNCRLSPLTVFPLAELEKPFRLMQAGKHIGKIVVSVKDDEQVLVRPRIRPTRLRSDATYVVVGGLGGIGRSICEWMAKHGAKHLLILSRNASIDPRALELESELATHGTTVRAYSCDVAEAGTLREVLRHTRDIMHPIRGVIHGAMVLRDTLFDQMTLEEYRAVIDPKIRGSLNLHHAFDNADLDFFIMLSSGAAIMGNMGQAHYTAGGTFQDALASHRVAKGLSGASIDVGAVRSVGFVAESTATADFLRSLGHMFLTEADVLRTIEYAIANPYCGQLILGLNTGPGPQWTNTCMGRDMRFAPLRYREMGAQQRRLGPRGVNEARDISCMIAYAETFEAATSYIVQGIREKLMDIFTLSEAEVDNSKSLAYHGVDSLVAVEIRNLLAMRAGAELSIFDVLQSPSLHSLAVLVASKSSSLPKSLKQ